MKNEQIGKILKKYRKMNQLSVHDVVIELSDKYGVDIAEKTLYGWESNQAHPSSSMFIALCDIYKITNVTDVFSEEMESKGFPITQEERHLIEQYRRNEDLQPVIRKILDLK